MNKGKKEIQNIDNPKKAEIKENNNIELPHIDPHNLAEYLNRIGNVEWEVEKDKNEIKRISEKLDLHITALNQKADVSYNIVIGIFFAMMLFLAGLLYSHIDIVLDLKNTINLQQEQIKSLEDDVKDLEDIVKKYFIK